MAISQNFTITVSVPVVVPPPPVVGTAIALSSTSFDGAETNAGELVGIISVTTNPPGGVYPGVLTLAGTDAALFAISNSGTVPCGLYIGAGNVAAGTYAIGIVGT